MKGFSLFSFDYLFSDNHAKLSNEAQLYYVKLMFFADNGFVANPIGILDSMSFDKSILNELINNGDLLVKPNRDEVFITSFFVHNKGVNVSSWKNTAFAEYWKDLWVKSNRIATLKTKSKIEVTEDDDTILYEMGVKS